MTDYDGPIGEYPPVTCFDVDPAYIDRIAGQFVAVMAEILGAPWTSAQ